MPSYKTEIECTAYCSCGYCCSWEWGLILPGPFYLGLAPSWMPLKLRARRKGYIENKRQPIFSKYWLSTSLEGAPYHGLTSNGRYPAQARPPILSKLSLMQYQKLLGRVLFPWKLLPRHGTIAADTDYYPFGTRMFVPGYGWGEVEDRGSAIKGPKRIDLYHRSHKDALLWGRRKVPVLVVLPGQSTIDELSIPQPVKNLLKGLDWVRHLLF